MTHRRFLVNGFDDELFIVEGNVSDLAPGEANLWGQSAGGTNGTQTLCLCVGREGNIPRCVFN